MTKQLSPLQLELLKVYSFSPTEKELKDVKKLLAQYFAERLSEKVEASRQENNISTDDLEKWLNES